MTDAGSMPISQLIDGELDCVNAETTLAEVAKKFDSEGYGALGVEADDGSVNGIVTERDLVRAVAKGLDTSSTTAGDVASTKLIWCQVDSTVHDVANEMMGSYLRHILVGDNGKLVGIISARDLLGIYATEEVDYEDEDID